jgi:hypothetical protein
VGVDGRGPLNQLTCFIVVIERISHKVSIVYKGLARAMHEHEI